MVVAPHKTAPEWIQSEAELFDIAFYLRQTDLGDVTREDAVQHYIKSGEVAGLNPSQYFDSTFYLTVYDDVRNAGLNALAHYIEYGRAERRYPNRHLLLNDAETLESSEFYSDGYYSGKDLRVGQIYLSDTEHYILFGGFKGKSLGANFDSGFYRAIYKDVQASRENPLVHYLRVGRKEGRYTNHIALNYDMERIRDGFDRAYYRSQLETEIRGEDAVRHYILEGSKTGLSPSPEFSQGYYLARYPDINHLGLEPFGHYLNYGKNEGRSGRPNLRSAISPGAVLVDPAKPTLLVANHEGSRTGAPMVGLALARKYSSSHNVITYIGRPGPLDSEFHEVSTSMIAGAISDLDLKYVLADYKRRFQLSGIVANSVETHALVRAALFADIPTVVLLHEFAEYTLPTGKVGEVVAAADRVLVPARIILESAQKELATFYGAPANNISIFPQGFLNPLPPKKRGTDLEVEAIWERVRPQGGERPKVVFGAGAVQIRKGVELFVQTAAEVVKTFGEDVVFLWVGDGYEPVGDLGYSLWVSEAITRMGLEKNVFLFPAQQGLDRFFSICDAFYLPSRLDPFPNVAVDALSAGLPVVCFEGATGIAELINDNELSGAAVPYASTTAAAAALCLALHEGKSAAAGNAAFIAEHLKFDHYADRILDEINRAKIERADLISVREHLASTNAFDAAFHNGTGMDEINLEVLTTYIARSRKGLSAYNPTKGFSDGLFKSKRGLAVGSGVVPLDLALSALAPGVRPITHVCHSLTGVRNGAMPEGGVALHIHMHYPELASYFVDRLNAIKQPIDVFVTTTDRLKGVQIEAAFADYALGGVEVSVGPNKGRDIGPFLTSMADPIRRGGYGLVGHLHGKKSTVIGGDTGDRWRDYLMDHLLGSPKDLAQIFDLFAKRDSLGLIFPEDRHSVGWSKNFEAAAGLAERMSPRPVLLAQPVFPLGNMFWARPAAVAPLWDLGLTWDDYPAEPTPYDGTILHAIERLIPAVCESVGFEWETVYKSGYAW